MSCTTQGGRKARRRPALRVGHAPDWDEVVIDGVPEARDFLAYYLKGDEVLAVLGAQRDTELCAIEECMRLNEMPSADEVRERRVD